MLSKYIKTTKPTTIKREKNLLALLEISYITLDQSPHSMELFICIKTFPKIINTSHLTYDLCINVVIHWSLLFRPCYCNTCVRCRK